MPGKDIVHTKMGMFLVRLRDRRRNQCDACPGKSHPCISCSAKTGVSLSKRSDAPAQSNTEVPLGSPRGQGQILPTKQLLAKMVLHPQVPHGARPHPHSTAAMWSWRWDRHHLSRTKPQQWYGVWTFLSEPLPVPMCTHTPTHTQRAVPAYLESSAISARCSSRRSASCVGKVASMMSCSSTVGLYLPAFRY